MSAVVEALASPLRAGSDASWQRSLATPSTGDGRPRHLVHVFPSFDVGGAQVRFAALAAGLGDRFRHTVLSVNGSYEAAVLIPRDLRVQYAAPGAPARGLPLRLMAYSAQLARLQPDLLMTYNWGAIEYALANLFRTTPHLHMEDGFGPEEAKAQLRRRVCTRHVALAASHVLVPSRTLQTIATRTWGLKEDRVHYVPNGLACRGEPVTRLDQLQLDLPIGRPRIIWAGALRPEKNPLRLLRAFAPLKDRAVLLVLGDGPGRAAVEAEAGRLSLGASLRLLGRRTDARDIIMQADILALSSDTEQMPFAVLEAMDAGLPVASTNVGDVRRMVATENRPFIVSPCSVALGWALRTLVEDPELRTRIGEANRRRTRGLYSLERMIRTHADLLDRVIGGGPPAPAHA